MNLDPSKKCVLHVGCGAYAPGKLHAAFHYEDWQEIRLDIDPDVEPDIVATMTDMSPVADESVDAVFSSHNIEHLYPHQVQIALQEFQRVLKPTGFALITLPDLQEAARVIADDQLTDPAYMSGLGPITPLDILFGHRAAMASGNLYMAHHTGFTGKTLMAALMEAGFAAATVQRIPSSFALWAIAFAEPPTEDRLAEAQREMLPLHAVLTPAE